MSTCIEALLMTPSAPPRLTLVMDLQPELIILGGGEAKKGGNCPTTRVNARFRARFIIEMECQNPKIDLKRM